MARLPEAWVRWPGRSGYRFGSNRPVRPIRISLGRPLCEWGKSECREPVHNSPIESPRTYSGRTALTHAAA